MFEISVAGLNHQTAPVEVRESLSWSREKLPGLLDVMESASLGGVPLSTCNRSEFYFLGMDESAVPRLKALLAGHFGISRDSLDRYLYEHRGYDAIKHLFRVASGLDSMIVGEDQIVGQVRQAYQAASEESAVPGLLARLFQQASRVGRRVRRESGIGRHALSVSRACVELARSKVSNLPESSVLVVGAGEAGQTAAEALSIAGAKDITVVNRTHSRAVEVAGRLSGRAGTFDELPEALENSDIVIACTGSPGYVLEARLVADAMSRRLERPLVLMDIAVPRDVDPASGLLRNVSLIDIDDLESGYRPRSEDARWEVATAEALVAEEAGQFDQWLQGLDSLPPVIDLRRRADRIREKELQRTLKRLNGKLTGEERDSIEAMTRAIVNKLLHSPTVYLKEQAPSESRQAATDIFGRGNRA